MIFPRNEEKIGLDFRNLGRNRLAIIGMIKSLYTVFVGLKPLFESDRGSWYLRTIQVVLSEEAKAFLEPSSVVSLLIIVPTDPFELVPERPVVSTRSQHLLNFPFLLIVGFRGGKAFGPSRQWVLLGLMVRGAVPLGQWLTSLAPRCTVFWSAIGATLFIIAVLRTAASICLSSNLAEKVSAGSFSLLEPSETSCSPRLVPIGPFRHGFISKVGSKILRL